MKRIIKKVKTNDIKLGGKMKNGIDFDCSVYANNLLFTKIKRTEIIQIETSKEVEEPDCRYLLKNSKENRIEPLQVKHGTA